MSSKAKRLGSLADIYQSQSLDGSITRLRLDRIHPSQEQPRQDRTVGIDDLAQSLKKDGLLSPIIVKKKGNDYCIIAGERRYHAASKLGWEQIECRIISRQEQDYWRIAIIENLQRENLNAEEEAMALLRLKKQDDLNDTELAKLVGKSRNYINEILGIAQLPKNIMEDCRKHGIQQHNMLIQVVQSYRKGNVEEFLQNYKKGIIRTIRNARKFNQKSTKDILPPPQKLQETKPSKANVTGFQMKLEGEAIIIQCPGKEEARQLSEKINKHFLKSS